jgi:hypothetical protein
MYTLRQPTGPIAIEKDHKDPGEEEFKFPIDAPVNGEDDLNCWDYIRRTYRNESPVEYISHC